jgi:hypothetical protein
MIRGWIQIAAISAGLATSPNFLGAQMKESPMSEPSRVTYHTAQVDGLTLFYREAGPKGAPTVVLLHGFPSSSHMFRELITRLSDKYHVVAPDYPGFGYSDAPSPDQYVYTFEHLADTVDHFLDQQGIPNIRSTSRLRFPHRIPAGHTASRTHSSDHHSEWQRLRRRAYLHSGGVSVSVLEGSESDNRGKVRQLLTLDATNFSTCRGSEIPTTSVGLLTFDQAKLDRPGNDKIGSSRCSTTIATTLHCIRRGISTYVRRSPPCWWSGARTTPYSLQPARKRF